VTIATHSRFVRRLIPTSFHLWRDLLNRRLDAVPECALAKAAVKRSGRHFRDGSITSIWLCAPQVRQAHLCGHAVFILISEWISRTIRSTHLGVAWVSGTGLLERNSLLQRETV
jgi:hypothetical protein